MDCWNRSPRCLRCSGGIDVRIVVETRQDHGIEVPRTLRLNVDRVEVVEVLDQWYGPDYRYCKVKGRRRCPLHPPPRRRPIRVAPHHVRECAGASLFSATMRTAAP